MFYTLRFNNSIAALGINPMAVPKELRNVAQVHGSASGCTPQEAVMIMLSNLPFEISSRANPLVAEVWIVDRKIRMENRVMQQACVTIGWSHLVLKYLN